MREKLVDLMEQYQAKIIGQEENLSYLLTVLLADGHVLIEGVPGTGKTQMVKTLATLVGGVFNRIQFTPDLLPSDITGSKIFNMKESQFETLKGPVFTNVLLADEINRTPAKTQAALLEAMEEKQVTIQGETFKLADLFFVAATQNPIEYEGTYPLPEAQQDRFMMKLLIDFPDLEAETKVLTNVLTEAMADDAPASLLTEEELNQIKRAVKAVAIKDSVKQYIVEIVRKTREQEAVQYGASTRAAIAIAKTAQAWAYVAGRDYVTPDDVKQVVRPCLRHRIQLSPYAEVEGTNLDDIIASIVGTIPVPR
ncbi:MoxR family ATPase [Amphibacillus indicireducens]|uniref:MoxR family ATPase n=1 Tax=Amphibacillus indicireducens TaxID=1076330 RepID=A0ABP7V8D1_9BACI